MLKDNKRHNSLTFGPYITERLHIRSLYVERITENFTEKLQDNLGPTRSLRFIEMKKGGFREYRI